MNLKNYEKAIDVLDLYLRKFPEGEKADEILKLLGDIYYKNYQKYNRAIAEYQKLIDNFPESKFLIEVMFNLAKNYYLLNNFSQAVVEYEKILKRFPNDEMIPSVKLDCTLLFGDPVLSPRPLSTASARPGHLP